MLWDICCKVIDNYGDAGVAWRLCAALAARGESVRLWIDDATPLRWMAPLGCPGVQVLPWPAPGDAVDPGDVVVEAFGCDLPEALVTALAALRDAGRAGPPWINLEYLSAEAFVMRSHGLPSPVMSGPARGLTRHFFYPGFTAGTGGLLREDDLLQRQARFDRDAWLRETGIPALDGARAVSLFCYEPAALPLLLGQLARGPRGTRLLVTHGRAAAASRAATASLDAGQSVWNKDGLLSISYLPTLTQPDFDHLLWSADLNFVRGEDSLVRAMWAGRPLVWQAYPQDDGAHHDKLEAWLDATGAPPAWRRLNRVWNAIGEADGESLLPEKALGEAREWALAARARLLAQDDLVTQLVRFVAKKR